MLIQHFLHHWMRRHSHTLTHTHILYEFLRCIDRPKLKDGERKRKKAKQTNKNRIRHIKINCIIYFSVSFCRRFYFIVVQIHHTHTMPWMSASSAWKFVLTRTRLHTRKKLPQKMKHAKRRRRSSSLRNSNHSLLYILLFMSIFINCCFVYIQTPRCHWMRFVFPRRRRAIELNVVLLTEVMIFPFIGFSMVLMVSGIWWKVKTIRYHQP